ncbi:hypothetical protein MUO14_19195 [Halobacillus shinanisalinarum]|uniref:Uncharacterized protein n=1 Tax=Halobacillus shinanisalinarum TaxID=2932258 RepID=A0ABY4GYS0_9BACI|nr:hypothetical protein [Halobacillus shinanisalinarum]UOQ92552.1 hypothetical protein MUO14_19195 [Halobacillus shinanisalinarum]
MRVFLITWSVALAIGALTFFYQTKILTSPPVTLIEAMITSTGALLAAVFFIWSLKEAPEKYRIIISCVAIIFFIGVLFLAMMNRFIVGNDEIPILLMDGASIVATGAVALYGGLKLFNKRSEE